MTFTPGERVQITWHHDDVVLAGRVMKVTVPEDEDGMVGVAITIRTVIHSSDLTKIGS